MSAPLPTGGGQRRADGRRSIHVHRSRSPPSHGAARRARTSPTPRVDRTYRPARPVTPPPRGGSGGVAAAPEPRLPLPIHVLGAALARVRGPAAGRDPPALVVHVHGLRGAHALALLPRRHARPPLGVPREVRLCRRCAGALHRPRRRLPGWHRRAQGGAGLPCHRASCGEWKGVRALARGRASTRDAAHSCARQASQDLAH